MSREIILRIPDTVIDWDSTKIGFFGSTIVVQQSGAAQAAVTQTSATVATANGSDAATTQALANALKVEVNKLITDVAALVVLANKLRLDLVTYGLIKGSA